MLSRKYFCLIIALSLACLFGARAETDSEVAARETALELAGAFSNDGFKIRDGHWTGTLAPNETRLIAVNLYAGNQYWFSLGGTENATKVGVEVFDETGNPVVTDKYQADGKAAAGLSVTQSGQYFIRVRREGTSPGAVCLVYSYK